MQIYGKKIVILTLFIPLFSLCQEKGKGTVVSFFKNKVNGTKANGIDHTATLPDEIKLLIAQYLTMPELVKLARTNRAWRQIANEELYKQAGLLQIDPLLGNWLKKKEQPTTARSLVERIGLAKKLPNSVNEKRQAFSLDFRHFPHVDPKELWSCIDQDYLAVRKATQAFISAKDNRDEKFKAAALSAIASCWPKALPPTIFSFNNKATPKGQRYQFDLSSKDLTYLPDNWEDLGPSVQKITFWNAGALEVIPTGINKVSSLEIIEIYNCPQLKNVPILTKPELLAPLSKLKTIRIAQSPELIKLLPEKLPGFKRTDKQPPASQDPLPTNPQSRNTGSVAWDVVFTRIDND